MYTHAKKFSSIPYRSGDMADKSGGKMSENDQFHIIIKHMFQTCIKAHRSILEGYK